MLDTSVKNLMFDLGAGREIYDAEAGRNVSKSEANDVIRKACFDYLGLTKDSTDKQIKRALNSERGTQFFEVIEEIIDVQIAHGLSENEFFNQYVETKNMKDGDRNEFWVDDEVLLTVGKIAGDAHNLSIQRLGAGQSYHVDTDVYGIKVGGDIRLFLTGRKDWGAFVSAVADAYMRKVQTMIASQFANGVNLIPVPAVLSGNGITLANAEGKWYISYYDYCRDNGIISATGTAQEPSYDDYVARAKENITRREYVFLFSRALPDSALPAVNTIPDNSIPDVPMSMSVYDQAIYKLYRAGILNGADAKGTFMPDSSIRRSEVAAILIRMMEPSARVDAPSGLGK